MEKAEVVRLLLRTGYLALSRKELDNAPLPQFLYDFGLSSRVRTIGGYVRFMEGMPSGVCQKCGLGAAVMTGWGVYEAPWLCTACGADFIAPSPVATGVAPGMYAAFRTEKFIWKHARNPTIVRSDEPEATEVAEPLLSLSGHRPKDGDWRQGLYDALVRTYADYAIGELCRFDAKASESIRAERPLNAKFRLRTVEGVTGEILLGNVGGWGQVFKDGCNSSIATLPVAWDEHLGLWPTLHAAAERLSSAH